MSTVPDAGTIVSERLTQTLDEVAVVVLLSSIHPASSVDAENVVELYSLTLDMLAFKSVAYADQLTFSN